MIKNLDEEKNVTVNKLISLSIPLVVIFPYNDIGDLN